MIAYVYFKENKIINSKLDNVSYIEINKIKNYNNELLCFGEGSDYIILENDTIDKNVGETIDISNLINCRDYFILGKDKWQENKIKKLEEQNDKLQDNNAEILFALMNGGLI